MISLRRLPSAPTKEYWIVFFAMPASDLKVAESFKYSWGKGEEQWVEWKIIPDAVWLHDHNDPLHYPERVEFHDPSIREGALDDPSHVFFHYVFPNVVGEYYYCLIT